MLEKLHQEFKSQGLVVLGLDVGEDAEVVGRFLRTAKLSYPIVLTAGTGTTKNYGVTKYPTVVLIDRVGIVRWLHRPDRHLARPSNAEVLSAVDQYLASRER